MALQWAKMRMIRWICGVTVTDGFTCNELKDGLITYYNYSATPK